ncbi:pyruvate kinase alpha/beta domain-containing protein [Nanoarchaeota archaeon]
MSSETKEITYFNEPGKVNTEKTIELAVEYAKKNGIKKIVVATYVGDTAMKVAEAVDGVKVIAVTLHAGTTKKERVQGWEQNVPKMKEMGIECYRGTQSLSGVERAMNKRYGGVFPLMIFVDALKLFSEGVKVGVEITLMAADAGLVSPEEDIIAIAGTGGGCDAAILVKPAYTTSVYDLGIKEILCMPRQVGVLHAPR